MKTTNPMIGLLCRALAFIVLTTGLVAQTADDAGALLAKPGGENAGGTGVWILPAAAFSTPDLTVGDLQLQLEPGGPVFTLSQSWVRIGGDLVMLIGADLVTAIGFFNSDVSQAELAPYPSGIWRRTYAPGL